MELDHIGAHCHVQECHQKDFLPFDCDACGNKFCLDHRSYPSHDCPRAESKDHRIIHCPVCRGTIHLKDNEDPNITWEIHSQSNCRPDQYQEKKKKKKERCGAEGCREILLASNVVQCTSCHVKVCLRHRFPSDHDCLTRKKSNQKKSMFRFSNNQTNAPSQSSKAGRKNSSDCSIM